MEKKNPTIQPKTTITNATKQYMKEKDYHTTLEDDPKISLEEQEELLSVNTEPDDLSVFEEAETLQVTNGSEVEIINDSLDVSRKVKRLSAWYLLAIGFVAILSMLIVVMIQTGVMGSVISYLSQDNYIFYWMVLLGFLAEMIAGSMGMGYGSICTAVLLLLNVPPHISSASIHSAQTFTTAAGSISHYKLRNINFKMVRILAPYAVLGAVVGSLSLHLLDKNYNHLLKPLIALYTLGVGLNIFTKYFFNRNNKSLISSKRSNFPLLGIAGGFIDAFAGGGWGPLVTGSLIKNGRTPRYVVGTSTFVKFLLTTTSAITFFLSLDGHHWHIILGLLVGGVVTAPFSAMLTAKLPMRKMTLMISIIVIILSSISLYKSLM